MAKKRTRTDRNEREEDDTTKATTKVTKPTSNIKLPASKQQRTEDVVSSSDSSDDSSDESGDDAYASKEGEDQVDKEQVQSNESEIADDSKTDNSIIVPTGKGPKVIVVLEHANLEAVKNGKGQYELLNCDDHLHLHKKLKRQPKDSRPDITHQALLTLLDSPLNKAGLLQIYIKTNTNVLIEVSPHLRIPRTFKRFAGLMVQLLHKFKIRASDGPKTLLEVIKNPVTRKLPPNARVFGADVDGTLVDTHDFVAALPDEPVVFVLGAMAQGNIQADYIDDRLSFSEYPLSAACALSRLTNAFERKYGIL